MRIFSVISKHFFLTLLGGLWVMSVHGQNVEIKEIYFEEAKVHILYKLEDSKNDRSYQINIYSSKDNFISPLQAVKGDLGVEIYPGDSKEIIWDPFEEFGQDFNDHINIEIRGRVYIPFVKLDDFNYESLKRGKSYEITWTGGASSNILNIDLYKEDNKVAVFSNIANVGEYVLNIPKKTEVGENYRLRISDKNNKDDVVFSKEFAIKRKIPLALQIAPVAIVGAGIYFLLPYLQSEESGFENPQNPPNLNEN
ncbi:Ser-Thr-rich GPI-anchored membrane family protein [Marivirga salinae]|uniref:Ser-Thr-rich GPI-anchored membrane family protein n=1 Tax=Marivirga salinarum TaxID=3059078 RepID=A0AA49GDA4_9BACT|nr:Ser-Thr-rich GPI-anchored membrane family protein [Marivirga sp. BDSF4-3]WKK78110.2 Ser-Thr-rich GPI-anchored membrane family protein [Marivirga sp. BDSF4-3]